MTRRRDDRPTHRGLPVVVALSADLAALLTGPDLDAPAACAGQAPAFDDQVDGETDDEREARHRRARSVCHRCLARTACTAAAAVDPNARGVWAGELRTSPVPPTRTRTAS